MDYGTLRGLLPSDAAGWGFNIDDDGYWLFSKHSPAGEDVCIEGVCESPETGLSDIQEHVREYAENYSVDDHVDIWKDVRGELGVPNSIEVLVEDAKEIGVMVAELNENVGLWEIPAQSDCTRCPICGNDIEPDMRYVPNEDGEFEMLSVCDCQRCFFAGITDGVKLFWGYSENNRLAQRSQMISEYFKYIDGLFMSEMESMG